MPHSATLVHFFLSTIPALCMIRGSLSLCTFSRLIFEGACVPSWPNMTVLHPRNEDDNQGPLILAVCWTLTVFATVIVMLRVYIRQWVLHNPGLDDYLIVISMVRHPHAYTHTHTHTYIYIHGVNTHTDSPKDPRPRLLLRSNRLGPLWLWQTYHRYQHPQRRKSPVI